MGQCQTLPFWNFSSTYNFDNDTLSGEPTDGSPCYSGWNIDDVWLISYTCEEIKWLSNITSQVITNYRFLPDIRAGATFCFYQIDSFSLLILSIYY